MKKYYAPNKLDLTGKRFDRLVVVELHENINWVSFWLCLCDCGKEKIVRTGGLRSGKIHSCGCFKREATIKRLTKHNESKLRTKEYRVWYSMKDRCINPNVESYPRYGGRGVKVCDRWFESYENFLKDVGRAPSSKHTADRFPNNDGDYEPNNFRWATKKQQAENRSSNVYITHNGETLTLSQWSERLGLKQYVFNNARNRGKSLEETLIKYLNK